MGDVSRFLQFVDANITEAASRGVLHLAAEDDRLDGRSVTLGGRARFNFGSCSYLGLEYDPRLKAAVIDALDRFGTQFSASRAYISAPPYAELEALLDQLTGGHTLVTPNTTLAHMAALPVLIGEEDAVILDHHVHQTVQLAASRLRDQGTPVEFIRHSRPDLLEERIRALKDTRRHIWYLADGVYSMYGSVAPVRSLSWLASQYEQLHLYLDDAHGTGWCGRSGRGYALEELMSRDRCVVALSLNKSFAAAGAALVFPDEAQQRKVRTCGAPLIFSGPVQPPMLGAAIASAKIHLSEEIIELQRDILERIRFANQLAQQLDIPFANVCEVPIRYVCLGRPAVAYDMAEHLLERGMLTNCAFFPAVPAKRSGVRFTLTRHQEFSDIRRLLEAIAEYLPEALARNGSSRAEVDRGFGRAPRRRRTAHAQTSSSSQISETRVEHETTIRAIDREEWDRCLGARGSFSWDGLCYLESVFGGLEKDDENHWGFHYYIVRDQSRQPVLATFFTDALWKDDMLSPAAVSKRVEAQRAADPRFLTSRVFAMGSLLTEGNHLYLNREANWQRALAALLDEVAIESEACGATSVVLRDLDVADDGLDHILTAAGFARAPAPDSMRLDVTWTDWDGFLSRLSRRSRRFQRRQVMPREGMFAIEILKRGGRKPSNEEWDHLYRLYLNVKERNFEVNTFPLPESFLPFMLEHDRWEIITLTLKPDQAPVGKLPHAFGAVYLGSEQFAAMVVGLDYRVVDSHGVYHQCLREVLRRAEVHGSSRILFGMGAELEKERFGACRVPRVLYFQSRDDYQHDVLSLLSLAPELKGSH